MTERGTGRTWRAIERLPNGSIYVVFDQGERDHCRRILRDMGRDPVSAIRLVTLNGVSYGALRGVARETIMDVDHAVYEMANHRQLDELWPWADRFAAPDSMPVSRRSL